MLFKEIILFKRFASPGVVCATKDYSVYCSRHSSEKKGRVTFYDGDQNILEEIHIESGPIKTLVRKNEMCVLCEDRLYSYKPKGLKKGLKFWDSPQYNLVDFCVSGNQYFLVTTNNRVVILDGDLKLKRMMDAPEASWIKVVGKTMWLTCGKTIQIYENYEYPKPVAISVASGVKQMDVRTWLTGDGDLFYRSSGPSKTSAIELPKSYKLQISSFASNNKGAMVVVNSDGQLFYLGFIEGYWRFKTRPLDSGRVVFHHWETNSPVIGLELSDDGMISMSTDKESIILSLI